MSIFYLNSYKTVQYFSTQQEFPIIMDKKSKEREKITNQGDYWINQEYSFSP